MKISKRFKNFMDRDIKGNRDFVLYSNNCRLVEATGLEIMADDMVGIKFNVTENVGTKNQNDYSEINLFRIHTETNDYGNREWFQLEQVNDDGGLNGFQWCNDFNHRQEFSVNLLNHRKNHKEQPFNR